MRAPPYDRGFDAGLALSAIWARIRSTPEFAHGRQRMLGRAEAICKGRTVAEMRELGGFSSVLHREIDALPDSFRDGRYGSKLFPVTIAEVLRGEVPSAREELQRRLSERFRGLS